MKYQEKETSRRDNAEGGPWDGKEQFQELALHIRQVVWTMDRVDAQVRYVSPAYEKVWGRTCQSFFSNPGSFFDAVHPLDRERVDRANTLKHETGKFDEEYRILRPDGSIRWIWDRGYPVRDPSAIVESWLGIAEDITDPRAIEDERARLAAIVEWSDDAIICMTVNGVVINWNHGAERLYGYSAEEMIGGPISVLFTPEIHQEYLRNMEKVRSGERISAYETVRRRKDGSLVNVSLGISPIEVRKGEITGASATARDITRIKRMEEQFRQAQRMESVGRLAAGLAHDFNNLLAIIASGSDLLLNVIPMTGNQLAPLNAIKNAAERATVLTAQLLALSRKQTLDPRAVDLNALVAGSRTILQHLVGETISLVTVLDPTLRQVRADSNQILQVLMNLVTNARDAMPKGGTLTIATSNALLDASYCGLHRDVKPGRYVLLAISDTGSGMDEETKTHIFEPFFTTKEPGKGTGLGLAMVHGFIKQSEGHVEVCCALPGFGTTFKIYIPEIHAALGGESKAIGHSQSSVNAGPTSDADTIAPE